MSWRRRRRRRISTIGMRRRRKRARHQLRHQLKHQRRHQRRRLRRRVRSAKLAVIVTMCEFGVDLRCGILRDLCGAAVFFVSSLLPIEVC